MYISRNLYVMSHHVVFFICKHKMAPYF
jgi:hypothetical protein